MDGPLTLFGKDLICALRMDWVALAAEIQKTVGQGSLDG